jgi:hypothetical protein|tara:strand:- start:649 stop:900 length:252 start_codon:yes stop_codon:yes gene_type:complete
MTIKMAREFDRWSDDLTSAEIRTQCSQLVTELETWGARPFRRDRARLAKKIKFEGNVQKLAQIRDTLDAQLATAMMRKLSRGM